MTDTQLDQLAINTIRTPSIDAVQAATRPPRNALWRSPRWCMRSGTGRCASIRKTRSGRTAIASCSPTVDASMLLWSMLHLTGTRAVNADDEGSASRRSRCRTSAGSASSGATRRATPSIHWVSGVETTTGPLGQGIATSVGMAIAQRWLASRYNRPGFDVFDYDLYAVCGDGCLMEGVGSEAGLARRPPRPRQPVLGVRQQSHHHRGQHPDRIHRGCGGALSGLRMERGKGG